MPNIVRRVWENEEQLWKLLLSGAYAGSVAGTAIVLGGLADVTSFCLKNEPFGIAAGMKLEQPLTALTTNLMNIQRAPVSNPDGSFNCGRFFRFGWTVWAMQLVFMVLFAAAWYKRSLRRFMGGLIAFGACTTAWHMERCNYTISMEPWTKGEVAKAGWVVAVGLVACMIGNFCMFFFVGPYAERERPSRTLSEASGSDGDMKGSRSYAGEAFKAGGAGAGAGQV